MSPEAKGFAIETGVREDTLQPYRDELKVQFKNQFPELKVGDIFPSIMGTYFDPETGPDDFDFSNIPGIKIVSVINQHRTKVCDRQTGRMEQFSREHPEITVITVSKLDPKKGSKELSNIAMDQDLTHRLVAIDEEGAEALGVGLKPDQENSDAGDEWNEMLLRAVYVLNEKNEIIAMELVQDQNNEPTYRDITKDDGKVIRGCFDVAETLATAA
ncbi:MAG: hypothetical protein Q7R49_05565 [Candidatus Daviesbacteria bacterium]|nr:hypothetical protein [Candidatus Daviesbacteria bacterium]